MYLIVVTIYSNFVLTMGLTFVSRRDYNRYPFDYNGYNQLIRPHRSIKSQSEEDWNLIKDEIRSQSKQLIKPVSFSNFLKSRSTNQPDEKSTKGKTKKSKKERSKKKTKNDGGKNGEDDDEDEEDEVEDDDEYDTFDEEDDEDEKMSASSGLDLGVLGQVDEMMAMVDKNTISPDGIHFDDSKLLEGNQKTKPFGGPRKKPLRKKEQVKVIRRSPHRSANRKLLRTLRRKTKANRYVSVPRLNHHLSTIDTNDNLDENSQDGEEGDTDDFGLSSVGRKISPASIMSNLQGSFMSTSNRNRQRKSKPKLSPSLIDSIYNQRVLSGSIGNKKKKSPLKMNLETDLEEVDEFGPIEKSIFDDSSLYPEDYIVVPRSEKDLTKDHQDPIPFQYNVEIRSRKNLKVKADPESSSNERFKKHEQKEEEHWHEKKWSKSGRFEMSQFAEQVDDPENSKNDDGDEKDRSVIAGDDSESSGENPSQERQKKKKKSKRKKLSKKTKDESPFNDLLHDEDNGHFDIPSKGFRINKRFVDWTENKINLS